MVFPRYYQKAQMSTDNMPLVTYYSVMSNETTYRMGLLLSRYALCVTELSEALQVAQPNISHKLARLREHGYVRRRRDGKRIFYRFAEPWRSILLHSDIMWHRLNPEFSSEGKSDLDRVKSIVGAELEERIVHPVITGKLSPPDA